MQANLVAIRQDRSENSPRGPPLGVIGKIPRSHRAHCGRSTENDPCRPKAGIAFDFENASYAGPGRSRGRRCYGRADDPQRATILSLPRELGEAKRGEYRPLLDDVEIVTQCGGPAVTVW